MSIAEQIYEASKPLPEYLALEVLNFIEYLSSKNVDRAEMSDLARAQEPEISSGVSPHRGEGMDDRHMWRVLQMAGLGAEDLGRLCGVSRVAAYTWINGGKVHPIREQRVDAVIQAIEAATNAREFPIERRRVDWRSEETLNKIKNIVMKHLHLLPKED